MKIVFYLQNSNFEKVDCSNILKGNPGLGGTQYMIIIIAYLLSLRENGIDVVLCVQRDGIFPNGLKSKIVANLEEAISFAITNDFDYISYAYLPIDVRNEKIYGYKHSKLKLLPWCHCFCHYRDLDFFASNANVYKIINVGKEQMDIYIDHPAYKKSTFIYNCVNTDIPAELKCKIIPNKNRKHIVTYLGSIVPMKSLHKLIQAWPKVIKHVPDAELYIIGSGKLYWRNAVMGGFGIAESRYEKYLLKPILKEGKIPNNVHFMGIMGNDKNHILYQTKVGIPNPLGSGETFCISAVEMQLMGASIAAKIAPGYVDTVVNGKLCNSIKNLADIIIELLNSENDKYADTTEYIKKQFSYEVVISDWETLINTGELRKDYVVNTNYRYKWLKLAVSNKKHTNTVLNKLPSLEGVYSYLHLHVVEKLKRFGYNRFDFHDVVD